METSRITDEITRAVQIELDSTEVDKTRLTQNLLQILDRNRQNLNSLAIQFHKLVGSESALTIPLSNGCVAKVNFSIAPTKESLDAFARIFQSIAENYVQPKVDDNDTAS